MLISSISSSSCFLRVVRSVTCVGEELLALFQLILLADRVEIDVAEALDLLAQLLDLVGDRVPIHVGRLISAGGFVLGVLGGQIELQFFHRALHERFQPHAQFAELQSGSRAARCSSSACSPRSDSTSPVSDVHCFDRPAEAAAPTSSTLPMRFCCCSTSCCFVRARLPAVPARRRRVATATASALLSMPLDLLLQFRLARRSAAAPAAGWQAAFPAPARATRARRSVARSRASRSSASLLHARVRSRHLLLASRLIGFELLPLLARACLLRSCSLPI